MSVYKLKPSCKDYLWGGHRLADEYGKEYDGEVLAETWELSCHPGRTVYYYKWKICRKNIGAIHRGGRKRSSWFQL